MNEYHLHSPSVVASPCSLDGSPSSLRNWNDVHTVYSDPTLLMLTPLAVPVSVQHISMKPRQCSKRKPLLPPHMCTPGCTKNNSNNGYRAFVRHHLCELVGKKCDTENDDALHRTRDRTRRISICAHRDTHRPRSTHSFSSCKYRTHAVSSSSSTPASHDRHAQDRSRPLRRKTFGLLGYGINGLQESGGR